MTTLYATFNDVDSAERAAGALLDYGVRPDDLSLIRKHSGTAPSPPPGVDPEPIGTDADSSDLTYTATDPYTPGTSRADDATYDTLVPSFDADDYDPETSAKAGITATTPEDAGAGAIKGAEIGLGVGALAALVSIFVPGVGLVAGGGALATALLGFAAATGAGAIAGAVTGYLKDQGMESQVADHYASAVASGAGLISVTVPSGSVDESTVRSIMDKYGASNVTNFASKASGGYVA